jgi:hypothetical protein
MPSTAGGRACGIAVLVNVAHARARMCGLAVTYAAQSEVFVIAATRDRTSRAIRGRSAALLWSVYRGSVGSRRQDERLDDDVWIEVVVAHTGTGAAAGEPLDGRDQFGSHRLLERLAGG